MKRKGLVVVLGCVLAVVFAVPCHAQQVIQVVYVNINAPNGGNGESWDSPYRSLQDALRGIQGFEGAAIIDFWIAEGVYLPDDGAGLDKGDKTLSFIIEDGMTLLGGFSGKELEPDERDPDANPVILSGDLSQNDGPNFTNIDDNSYSVVRTCEECSGNASLDGLVIRGGNAESDSADEGGGVRITQGLHLSLLNCTLEANSAFRGGAIAADNALVTIDGCAIVGNRGTNDAAGLLAEGSTIINMTNTTFSGNLSPLGEHVIVNDFGSRINADDSDLDSAWNIGAVGPAGKGAAGSFSIANDYEQQNDEFAGAIEFDLGGTTPGASHDRVDIGTQADLTGLANLSLIGPYMPTGPEVFALLETGAITDRFDIALLPYVENEKSLQLTYDEGDTDVVKASLFDLAQILDFGDPVEDLIPDPATDVALGDFDFNGFRDAAITVPATVEGEGLPGSVIVLLNNGNDGGWLGFGTQVQIPVGVHPVAIAVGDVNGDETQDIVVANYSDNTVSVLLNNFDFEGGVSFNRTDYATGGIGPVDVAIGDIIGGFGADIIVANEGGNVTILTQSSLAGGGFIVGAVLDDPVSPGSVDPADLDNDKDLDLVIGDKGNGSILAMTNFGQTEFGVAANMAVGGAPEAATAQDIDGDGTIDLTALVPELGTMAVALFEIESYGPVILVPVGDDAESMTHADVDDDGDSDIAIVARNDAGDRFIQVLRNDSTAQQVAYTLERPVGEAQAPRVVTAGDIDNDGIADLVAPGASFIIPLAGDSSEVVVTHQSTPRATCPADTNGSGAVDVTDLLALLAAWGPCPAPCPPDINGSGAVDVTDLLAVLAAWGSCS